LEKRKDDFAALIKKGNETGLFRDANSSVVQVPNTGLLQDVPTWWDSTYSMIEHLLQLRPVSIPAISCFMAF